MVERIAEHNRVRFKTVCLNQRGETVLRGEAVILPPKSEISYTEPATNRVTLLEWSLLPYQWTADTITNWTRFYADAVAAWSAPTRSGQRTTSRQAETPTATKA